MTMLGGYCERGGKGDFGVCGETNLSMFISAFAKIFTNSEKTPVLHFAFCLKWLISLYWAWVG